MTEDSNTGTHWGWYVAGFFGVGAVGVAGAVAVARARSTVPKGFSAVSTETYRGHVIRIYRSDMNRDGKLRPFAFSVDVGPGGNVGDWFTAEGWKGDFYLLPSLATAAAKRKIDAIEATAPTPVPVPSPDPLDSASSGGERDLVDAAAAHGITLQTTNGQCAALVLESADVWLPWARDLLGGLNFDAWTPAEIMDRVWSVSFPDHCADLSEIPGMTIAGVPYPQVLEAFAEQLAAGQVGGGEGEVGFQLDESLHLQLLAGAMVGIADPPAPPVPETDEPQFPTPLGFFLTDLQHAGQTWRLVAMPVKEYNEAVGQNVVYTAWFVWPEGVPLQKHKAVADGKAPNRAEAVTEANEAIGALAP